MAHTLDRCEHDGIKWFPRVTVEKYSPDQTAWAERRLHDELSWGRRLLVSRLGVRVPRLHGDWLREVFGEPEDGYARCEGNLLVNGGLDALANALSGTAGPQLKNASNAICGVGSTSTTAVVADTHLGADGTTPNGTVGAWYQAFDATYPSVDGSVHGQLDGQSTFTGSNANMNWVEWCWATTTSGTVTGGATLSGVTTGTEVMFNHWTGTSLGTKGSGATWVFSTTITFS